MENGPPLARPSARECISRWICLLAIALVTLAPLSMFVSWQVTVQDGLIPWNWPFGDNPLGGSTHGPWHGRDSKLDYGFDKGMSLCFWALVCSVLSCLSKPNLTAFIVGVSSAVLAISAFVVFLPLFD